MSDNSNTSPALPPAGWYPDPEGGDAQRYWDGGQWAAAGAMPAGIAVAESVRRVPKLRWWQWALLGVGLLVVIGVIAGVVGGGRGGSDASGDGTAPVAQQTDAVEEPVERIEKVMVPDMVGSTVAEARTKLAAAGLTLEATDAGDDWVVTSQQPSAGSHPLEGLELSITSEAPKPGYTLEPQNALEQAQSYLQFSSFSRQGLIDQLSSEYGSGYPVDVATWAADTVGADWNAEAVEQAQSYLEYSSFSRQGLFDQLTSPYGSQFTADEANYALAAVGY